MDHYAQAQKQAAYQHAVGGAQGGQISNGIQSALGSASLAPAMPTDTGETQTAKVKLDQLIQFSHQNNNRLQAIVDMLFGSEPEKSPGGNGPVAMPNGTVQAFHYAIDDMGCSLSRASTLLDRLSRL